MLNIESNCAYSRSNEKDSEASRKLRVIGRKESLLLLALLRILLFGLNLLSLRLVLLGRRQSVAGLVHLVVHGATQTAGVSVLVVSHVDAWLNRGLLFESSDLAGGVIDGEVVEQSLGSGSVLVRDLLRSRVGLLLSLPLAAIERHVDGDLALVDDTTVNKHLVAFKGTEAVLQNKVLLGNLEASSDLGPINCQ